MNSWTVLDKINTARGLGSSNQCYNIMYSIARGFNVRSVIEIGTHRGASAIVFAQAILDNDYVPEIHTIDNYLMYTDHRYEGIKEQAVHNIYQAGLQDYITMYDGDSVAILPDIFDMMGKFELCFIDGDHSIPGVIRDFEICEPYADLILFHDTQMGKLPYLDLAREKGYTVLSIPTRYVEGNGHLVGISVAHRRIK